MSNLLREFSSSKFMRTSIIIPLIFIFTIIFSISAQAESLQGTLSIVIMDDFIDENNMTSHTLYYLEVEERSKNKFTTIQLKIQPAQQGEFTKLHTGQEISIKGEFIDLKLFQVKTFSILPSRDAEDPHDRNSPKNVKSYLYFRISSPLYPASSTMDKIVKYSKNIKQQFASMSFNFEQTSKIDYVDVNIADFPPACSFNEILNAARNAATTQGFNIDNYNRWVYILPLAIGCNFSGIATLGCSTSSKKCFALVIDNGEEGELSTMLGIHELGHNLGLGHANRYGMEYGDGTCPMGSLWSPGFYNAPHMMKTNWLQGAGGGNVTEISQFGTYSIRALSDVPSTSTIPQVMKIAGENFWLSYRQQNSIDQLGSNDVTGVHIHNYNTGNFQTYLLAILENGRGYMGATGSIRQNGISADGKVVSFSYAPTTTPFVVAIQPAGNDINVPLESPITITFSEPMDPNSLSAQWYDGGQCDGSIRLSRDGHLTCLKGTLDKSANPKIVFRPANSLSPSSTYVLRILKRVKSAYNAPMDADYENSPGFQTVAPNPNPVTLTATLPVDGSKDVARNGLLEMTFSRPITAPTITTIAKNGPCTGSLQVSMDNFVTCLGGTISSSTSSKFIFKPLFLWNASTTIRMRISNSVTSADGAPAIPYTMPRGFTSIAGRILYLSNTRFVPGGTDNGLAKADNYCNTSSNRPASSKMFKAMLTSTARRACSVANCGRGSTVLDWVLAPNTTYYRPDGAKLFTTNAAAIVGTYPMANMVSSAAINPWTGLNRDWTNVINLNCNNWTATTGKGGVGWAPTTSNGWIAGGSLPCNQALPLYCVEQ